MASGSRGAAAPAALLAGARAEQLRLGEHRDARCRQQQAPDIRRHGERQALLAAREGGPVRHRRHGGGVRPQHRLQHFAPPRANRPRSARGPRSWSRKLASGASGSAARGIDAQLRCARGREVAALSSGCSSRSALKPSSVMLVSGSAACASSCGVRNSSGGASIGPLDVVATLLVAAARCRSTAAAAAAPAPLSCTITASRGR